ncbi:hypothetical protein GCM10022243_49200 [Saccharothrix violaceirubra]|uniref:Uncharacterized protein n=1 Tax=Saccharothrix violaceirubra TaxID=413306 RepID=A0A7W7WU24_9PSEU|nr:hypothetical protein [Saccharothrix violaceirubra]MBB4963736.1 hypothetical protein [Saccharothrix violaceirubra]
MTFFPTPDEFYRDPLYLGLSAQAIALWTVAGSWSADRLTDGFVPTAALALFPTIDPAAADELVARGIWKRARGGHQYVDWPRTCSREYVLAKREKERDKKRGQRAANPGAGSRTPSSKPVVSPGDTRGDTPGTHVGSPSGSPRPSSKPVQPVQPNKEQPPSGVVAPTRPRASAGTYIPEDFTATDEMIAWARKETPLVGAAETDQFRDYWLAACGPSAKKRNWLAAWRKWMREAQAKAEAAPVRPHPLVRQRQGLGRVPTTDTGTVTGSRRMDKVLAALEPDDPFLADYLDEPPTNDHLLVIEGGRTA